VFNRSTQHLLILLEEEVCDGGDCTDMVHQCVADIARALERRNKSGVYRILALNGGIAPETRRRAAGALRLEEREEISRGIAAGRSMRRIAQGLRRSPSTVSREIRRNGGCSAYRAGEADRRVQWERRMRKRNAIAQPAGPATV
jgi:DNA-binding NarL/FixJ family response regulator